MVFYYYYLLLFIKCNPIRLSVERKESQTTRK